MTIRIKSRKILKKNHRRLKVPEESGQMQNPQTNVEKDLMNDFYKNRYYSLLEAVNDVVYKYSITKNRYEYISPQTYELLGYASEEFHNNPNLIRKLIHKDSFRYFKENWRKLLRGEVPNFYEIKAIKKNGECIWIQQKNRIIMDESGNPEYIEGILTDITEKKLTEEALKKSEQRFRKYVESSPTNIFIINASNKILFVNPATCKLLGFKRNALMKKSFHDILLSGEEGSPAKKFNQLLESPGSLTQEFIFKRKNKKLINVIADVAKLTDNEYILYCIDITERKAIEKAFKRKSQLLMEAQHFAKTGNWVLSTGREFIEWSDEMYHIFGLIIKKRIPDFSIFMEYVHPQDRLLVYDKVDELISTKREISSFDFRIILNENTVKYLHLIGRLVFKRNHEIDYLFGTVQDITDRVLAENQVKQTESRFRNIFNSSPMGIHLYNTDSEGRLILTDVNPAADTLTGFDHRGILNLSIEEAFPGLAGSEASEQFKKVACEGTAWHAKEFEYTDVNISGVFDVWAFQTSPGKIAVMFTEVSERKKAEIMLRVNEEKYRSFVQNSITGVFKINLHGEILLANDALSRIFGYAHTDEFLSSKLLNQFLRSSDFSNLAEELTVQNSINDFEINTIDKYGRRLVVSINASLVKHEISGVLIDITEKVKVKEALIESETQKIGFLNTLPHLAWLKDIKGRYIIVNDSFARSRNYKAGEIVGKTDFDIYDGSVAEKYRKEDRKIIETGKPSFFEEETGGKWHETFKAPLISDEGDIVGVTGISLEITERKINEENIRAYSQKLAEQNEILRIINDELVKAKDRAEESDRLKSAFLANMSHEIRTPMNAILGFASLLKSKKLSEERKKAFIDIINSKSKQLLQIITDIIDISKIEANQIKINNKNFSLNELIKQLVVYFNTLKVQEKKTISIKASYGKSNRNSWIYSDKVRIEQILTNLLSNAFKFTEKGEIRIGYTITNDGYIQFFVRDTGIGLSPEERKVIFDRFRQASSSFNRIYGGTGLGLSISKGLADKLGGKIWVESQVNKGSTFYLKIPYAIGEKTSTFLVRKKDAFNWDNKTILIAEDEDVNFSFIETLIKPTKAFIIRASDGIEAVDLCRKNSSINLVLMDIKLPRLGGLEATKEIKKFRQTLPIIAHTAYAMSSDEDSCLQAGCDAYVSKPIKIEPFMKLIEQFL